MPNNITLETNKQKKSENYFLTPLKCVFYKSMYRKEKKNSSGQKEYTKESGEIYKQNKRMSTYNNACIYV